MAKSKGAILTYNSEKFYGEFVALKTGMIYRFNKSNLPKNLYFPLKKGDQILFTKNCIIHGLYVGLITPRFKRKEFKRKKLTLEETNIPLIATKTKSKPILRKRKNEETNHS